MQVFCDFDGTISLQDTTDQILEQFAAPAWRVLESQWEQGLIGSALCMSGQVALIHANLKTLNAALDALPIDPAFPDFVKFCKARRLPIVILSDGVDYFIKRILERYKLADLPVIANKFHIVADGTYSLTSPHASPICNSSAGVCKCNKISASLETKVFVGDGNSDFCASESADLLFAKKKLAHYCDERKIPYTPYINFSDVQAALQSMLPAHHRQAVGHNLHSTF